MWFSEDQSHSKSVSQTCWLTSLRNVCLRKTSFWSSFSAQMDDLRALIRLHKWHPRGQKCHPSHSRSSVHCWIWATHMQLFHASKRKSLGSDHTLGRDTAQLTQFSASIYALPRTKTAILANPQRMGRSNSDPCESHQPWQFWASMEVYPWILQDHRYS